MECLVCQGYCTKLPHSVPVIPVMLYSKPYLPLVHSLRSSSFPYIVPLFGNPELHLIRHSVASMALFSVLAQAGVGGGFERGILENFNSRSESL